MCLNWIIIFLNPWITIIHYYTSCEWVLIIDFKPGFDVALDFGRCLLVTGIVRSFCFFLIAIRNSVLGNPFRLTKDSALIVPIWNLLQTDKRRAARKWCYSLTDWAETARVWKSGSAFVHFYSMEATKRVLKYTKIGIKSRVNFYWELVRWGGAPCIKSRITADFTAFVKHISILNFLLYYSFLPRFNK